MKKDKRADFEGKLLKLGKLCMLPKMLKCVPDGTVPFKYSADVYFFFLIFTDLAQKDPSFPGSLPRRLQYSGIDQAENRS